MRPVTLDRGDEFGHVYGSAADAPEPLLDLLSENEEACGNALGHLDVAHLLNAEELAGHRAG
ncbi:hypothetical protein JNUCC0626_46470 [Lentzea sp. JNUCC 0626]|uniref:hypothetical protein n=1 Tax=Lentzea sp. JNUCC 0626 TaxID=3367513 RepID=UPI0037492D20